MRRNGGPEKYGPLLLLTFPRYNQIVLRIGIHARWLLLMAAGALCSN
jgi:hypothetical protein